MQEGDGAMRGAGFWAGEEVGSIQNSDVCRPMACVVVKVLGGRRLSYCYTGRGIEAAKRRLDVVRVLSVEDLRDD